MVSGTCIWCLVSCEYFGSVERAARRDMKVKLRAGDNYGNNIDTITIMQRIMYQKIELKQSESLARF